MLKKGLLLLAGLSLIVLGFELSSFSSTNPIENSEEIGIESYAIVSWHLPEQLDFAGEPAPLDDPDIAERFDRELLVNTYWHSHTFLNIKRANKLFPIIEPILKENGIPNDFKYLAVIESNLDFNARSPAGASSIWQFMKETAKIYGLQVTEEIDERYQIEKATKAACDYLNDAYTELGTWTLAAAAYNAGVAKIKKLLKSQKVDTYYNLYMTTETNRFIFRILAVKEILMNPKKYGFNYTEDDLYKSIKYKTIIVDTTISDLAEFAVLNNTNYKTLKKLNPWLRTPHLTNKTGKEYEIKLPAQ
ncbi:MAG: lytic transglycosylase domain-containing protein [Bacteroidetes bacterium]|nr:lytic transglycosylase domain-containing protein [Bacteroidota bacterium]